MKARRVSEGVPLLRSGGPAVNSPGREAWVSHAQTPVGPEDRHSFALRDYRPSGPNNKVESLLGPHGPSY